MTHKVHLNANLRDVLSRLAGEFNAGVASTGKAADSYPAVESSSLSTSPSLNDDFVAVPDAEALD